MPALLVGVPDPPCCRSPNTVLRSPITVKLPRRPGVRHVGEGSETMASNDARRPRLRDLGITIGSLPPGPLNAITDVGASASATPP